MTGRRVHHSTPALHYGPALRVQRAEPVASSPNPPTATELRALTLIADGLSYREVAVEMRLSDGAVRGALSRLYRKLGASTSPHAVAIAFRRELLK